MAKNVDIVSEMIGDWGPWQFRTVILIFLCKIPSAWFMACIIFTAPIPKPGEISCYQPETQVVFNQHARMMESQQHISSQEHDVPSADFCFKLNPQASSNDSSYAVMEHQTNQPESMRCTAFQFNAPFETTITKFGLICSRSILIATSQFFHLFGVLTGGILATKLMDFMSPRNLMVRGMVIQIFIGCFAGLVSNYEMHMLFRYLAAVCCAQMYTAGQVIFTDITGNKYRTTSICLFETFWSIGVILLPAIAVINPNWSSIFLMISLPTIFYIPIWRWIPDTPRWFLSKGRLDEAVGIIESAIAVNHTQRQISTSEIRQRLVNYAALIEKDDPPAKWHSLWSDSRRTILQIVAIHVAWAVYVTNYNGMLLNVKTFGREHLSFNTIALGISEIVGVFIGYFLILNSKKKWQYAGIFNIFAGLFASIGYLYPSSLPPNTKVFLLMLTAIIPKMAVSCSQSILFTCTAELVKPEKRKILVLSCIVWARIWLLTAPFVGALFEIHHLLPLSIFGLLSALGGISTCLITTPRTIEKECPEMELPPACVPGRIFIVEKYCL